MAENYKGVTEISSSGKRKREEDNEITIFVKTFDGKTLTLKVKRSDTIGYLKLKICDKICIPVEQLALIFNEIVLDDIYTLANLSIKKDCTFILMRKSKGLIKIFIKEVNGCTISLEVKPSDTVGKVKDMIHYPYNRHAIIFNGMILEDSGTLADFHIKNDSTLTTMVTCEELIEIFIRTLTGATITVEVKPRDTVGNVKHAIADKVNLPPDEQALIFNESILDDCGTLFDYSINREDVVTLMRISRGLMEIFIKTLTGETITLKVKPTDTIEVVKSKIKFEVKIPPDEFALILNEMVLDDNCTLVELNIKRESTLTLMRKSKGLFRIFVHFLTGQKINLDVKPSYTVANLKAKIEDKEGVPPNMQKVTFNGKQLVEGLTLADYHIYKGSILHHVLDFSGGSQEGS